MGTKHSKTFVRGVYMAPSCTTICFFPEGRQMIIPASAGQDDYEYKDFWGDRP